MEYRKQQFETYEAFTQQFSCDYSKPLARGGHGEVYRGVDLETNEEVAIKRRLYSPDSDLITLEKEFLHTQALPPNRFVVRYVYYGRYATPFGTFEFLVMKFYRDGNLTHNSLPWNQLSESQQRRFTEEFLKGLAHLHHHQVIHRDIKPENILLVKYIDADGAAYRPVIADFGISKLLAENPEAHTSMMQNSMRVGTVTYMAPEQLRASSLNFNADLWSFGIILYELITGKYMIARRSFPDLQREEAYTFWRNADEQRFPADMDTIAEPYQQIIRRCLLADPKERVQSTDELLTLLSLQPQLAQVDRLIKEKKTAQAIELLEAIDQRATLPSVTQKLNELRLNQSLAASPEAAMPTADRPFEVDESNVPSPMEPVVPATTIVPWQDLLDDTQRTQQFTEQLDPASLAAFNQPTPSPLAAFHTPEPVQPIPGKDQEPEPVAKPAKKGKKPAKLIEADVLPAPPPLTEPVIATAAPTVTEVLSESPTPDEVFTELPTPDRPADALIDEPTEVPMGQLSGDVLEAEIPTAVAAEPVVKTAPRKLVPAPKPPREPLPIREWVEDLTVLSKQVYERIRTQQNSRLLAIAGLGLIVASVLIYSSGTSESAVQPLQTSPVVSEDYRKALKLFKQYQINYEKTGDLDPYLWSFVHCNPDYDDSLVNSAIVRAKYMGDYTRLFFPDHEVNLTGFKRQEMRHMLVSKVAWEKLPHDPNCAPGQLLENESKK